MASKRRAPIESTNSRKKARAETSETSTAVGTRRTTRSGRASLDSNRAASKNTSKKDSITANSSKGKHSRATVQSSRQKDPAIAKSEDVPKPLQDTKEGQNDPGSEQEDARKDLKQYWLMKAEPEDRFENGYNVKFSIDDLEAASGPEPWDGVRNYVARNNMRAMKKGDLAFFYHSNCKVPGIVGVMRIVQEHTVDESAFDPKHPYYDQKSQRDKPRWDLVHVGFVKKFDDKIGLKDIQNNAATTKELSEMDLLKYKRLSVTAVKPHEWKFIVEWAGEPITIGESTK